jgi:hypothetical protein
MFGRSKKKPQNEIDAAAQLCAHYKTTKEGLKKNLQNLKDRHAEIGAKDFAAAGEFQPHPELTAERIELEANLQALDGMIQKTTASLTSLIAKSREQNEADLLRVEDQVLDVKRSIDTRKAKKIARLAHDLKAPVTWPSKNNGGGFGISVMSIGPDEVKAILAEVQAQAPEPDPQAGELEALLRDRERLVILLKSTPDMAALSMIEIARRGAQ